MTFVSIEEQEKIAGYAFDLRIDHSKKFLEEGNTYRHGGEAFLKLWQESLRQVALMWGTTSWRSTQKSGSNLIGRVVKAPEF